MDHALDTYWDTIRSAEPDAVLLGSQTEVKAAGRSAWFNIGPQATRNRSAGYILSTPLLAGNADRSKPAGLIDNPGMTMTRCCPLCAAELADVHFHGHGRDNGCNGQLGSQRRSRICRRAAGCHGQQFRDREGSWLARRHGCTLQCHACNLEPRFAVESSVTQGAFICDSRSSISQAEEVACT